MMTSLLLVMIASSGCLSTLAGIWRPTRPRLAHVSVCEPFECVNAVVHHSIRRTRKKPRGPRGSDLTEVPPKAALLVLLLANGRALVITMQPACGKLKVARERLPRAALCLEAMQSGYVMEADCRCGIPSA